MLKGHNSVSHVLRFYRVSNGMFEQPAWLFLNSISIFYGISELCHHWMGAKPLLAPIVTHYHLDAWPQGSMIFSYKCLRPDNFGGNVLNIIQNV